MNASGLLSKLLPMPREQLYQEIEKQLPPGHGWFLVTFPFEDVASAEFGFCKDFNAQSAVYVLETLLAAIKAPLPEEGNGSTLT